MAQIFINANKPRYIIYKIPKAQSLCSHALTTFKTLNQCFIYTPEVGGNMT
jgi:hypothetical protein